MWFVRVEALNFKPQLAKQSSRGRVMSLMQATFDDAGGVEVDDEPTRDVTATSATLQSVSVVAGSQQNYAVPADELVSLAAGNDPSSDAPDDYAWVDYPFLITARGGQVVEARQIWLAEPIVS